MVDGSVRKLAALIRERNAVATRITEIIGRPALIGHVGEYIASELFDIQLEHSAVSKGVDGAFRSGPLAGKTVNVKFYAKRESLLDINPDAVPDYYLVLAGPKSKEQTSRGEVSPWHIDWIFLFHGPTVLQQLKDRGVKIGVASSVVKDQWHRNEIYPNRSNPDCCISDEVRELLRLFGSGRNMG